VVQPGIFPGIFMVDVQYCHRKKSGERRGDPSETLEVMLGSAEIFAILSKADEKSQYQVDKLIEFIEKKVINLPDFADGPS
jgi:hypothetical protein